MNINNLFFQLHYCNSSQPSDVLKFSNRTINRTIHHIMNSFLLLEVRDILYFNIKDMSLKAVIHLP